jgi:hypothetical protein
MEPKGSRLLLVLDIFIIVVVALSLCAAGANQLSSSKYKQSILQVQKLNGIDTWDIAYNFTTNDVFSALNPITVDVIVHIDTVSPLSMPNATLPSVVYIYFPDAIPIHPQYTQYGELISQQWTIPLKLDRTYRNSTTILFGQEGQTCAILTTNPLPYVGACNLNVNAPILTISSAQALYQYQTTRITVTLTYVVVAFTVILAHEFVSAARENILRLWHERKKESPKPK